MIWCNIHKAYNCSRCPKLRAEFYCPRCDLYDMHFPGCPNQ